MQINGTPIFSLEALRLTSMAKKEEARQIAGATQKAENIKIQQLEQQRKIYVNLQGQPIGILVDIFA